MPANEDTTVVIPCLDYGRFLPEAVRSALAQAGGPPRVVVVDDGSSDPETLSAFEALPDGVELLRRVNEGVSAARNAGAYATATPYVLMLDADDRLAPRAIKVLRAALDADTRAGFSYGYAELFGAWSGRLEFPDYDPYRLLYRSLVGATSLIRRDVFQAVGGFDPTIPGYEDWDFYLGALERGFVGRRVPEVVLLYRRHCGSRVSRDRAAYRRHYRAIRAKHRDLFRLAPRFARDTDLGAAGRLVYRTWFAWRPLPARLEQAFYRALFRGSARSRANSTTSANWRATSG